MSWDVRWRLRAFEPARFEAAVRAAAGELEVRIEHGDRSVAHVKLPRALVEHHAYPPRDSLPPEDFFWGTIELVAYDGHPLSPDGPYETLASPLLDANGDPAGQVVSLCAYGDGLLAATLRGHAFAFGGRRWDELAWPDDVDDVSPRCVGVAGDTAWAAGDRIYRIRGFELAIDADAEQPVIFVGGDAGRTVTIGEEGLVQVRDGERWTTIDRDSLGWAYGFAVGPSGIYVSAPLALLARVADRVTPIDAPDDITDCLWETPAIAVAPDGAVWLAQRGFAARYDGTWTRTRCEIDKPIAMVVLDGAPIVVGEDARAARWTGTAWESFAFDAEGTLSCACVSPDHTIVVGGEGRVYELERRGPVHELEIHSNTSANREAWGAICELGQRVATALGAGPAR